MNLAAEEFKIVVKTEFDRAQTKTALDKLQQKLNLKTGVKFTISQARQEIAKMNNKLNLKVNIVFTKGQVQKELKKFNQLFKIKVDTQIDEKAQERIDKLSDVTEKVSKQTKTHAANVERSAKAQKSFSQHLRETTHELSNAAVKFALWSAVTVSYFAFIRGLKSGVQTVIKLENAMIELQKVTSATEQQYQSFKETSFELAQELGRTGEEVIQATARFAKMGFTIKESAELARDALLLVNVGDDLDVDKSTKAIISSLKGFDLAVSESTALVDAYNEVANTYSISIKGISEAMSRSSATMAQAGNSYQETIALITAANAVVQDPAKVGNAFKTIALRMRDTGVNGQKLQGILDKVGISMKKDNETFKSTFDILTEVAGAMDKFTDIEQTQLLELIGGKRQATVVAATLKNIEDAHGALESAINSSGSAMRENEKILASTEGKINRLKNSAQEFWNEVINTEAVKDFIDAINSIVQGVTALVKAFGALPVVLTTAITLISLFNSKFTLIGTGKGGVGVINNIIARYKEFNTVQSALAAKQGAVIGATTKMSSGFRAMGATMTGTRIAAIAMNAALTLGITFLISTAISAMIKFANAAKEAKKAIHEAGEEAKGQVDQNNRGIKSLKELTEEYDNLRKQTQLSVKEQDKMAVLMERIAEVVPEAITGYDEYGRAIVDVKKEMEEYIEVLKEKNREEQFDILKGAKQEYDDATEALEAYKKALESPDITPRLESKGILGLGTELPTEEEREAQRVMLNLLSASQQSGGIKFDFGNIGGLDFSLADAGSKIAEAQNKVRQALSETTDETAREALRKQLQMFDEVSTQYASFMADVNRTNKDAQAAALRVGATYLRTQESFVELGREQQEILLATVREFGKEGLSREEIVSEITTLLNTISSDAGAFEDFSEQYGEFTKQLSDAKTPEALKKLEAQWEKNIETFSKDFGVKTPVLERLFPSDIREETLSGLEGITKQGISLEQMLKRVKEVVEPFSKEMKELETAFETLSAGRSLDIDTIIDLSSKYDEFNELLSSGTSLYEDRGKVIKTIIDRKKQEFEEGVKQEVEEAKAQKAKIQAQIDFNKVLEKTYVLKAFARTDFSEEEAEIEKIDENIKRLNAVLDSVNKYEPDEQGSAKLVKDLELQLNIYKSQEDKLKDIANQLDIINAKIALESEDTEGDARYIALQTEKIRLLKEQQIEMHNINEARREEAEELKGILEANGLVINSQKNVVNEIEILKKKESEANRLSGKAKEKAIEQVKDLQSQIKEYSDLVKNKIPQTSTEWFKVQKAIKDVTSELAESTLKQIVDVEAIGDAVEAQIKLIEDELDTLKDDYDEDRKNLEAKIDALEDINSEYNKAIKLQEDRINKTKEENELLDRQNKLRDIGKKIDEAKEDTRFTFITAEGEEILTFNKSLVADLESQRDELKEQYRREDLQQAQEDELQRLKDKKEAKKKEYEDELKDLKNTYEEERKEREKRLETIKDDWEEDKAFIEERNQELIDSTESFWQDVTSVEEDRMDDLLKKYKSFIKEKQRILDTQTKKSRTVKVGDTTKNTPSSGLDALSRPASSFTPYATGGLNTETGLAMLHGTPARPEAVLNPEETANYKKFTAIMPDITNMVENFNKLIRGDFPNATPALATPSGTTTTISKDINIQEMTVVADNPEEFYDKLDDLADRINS